MAELSHERFGTNEYSFSVCVVSQQCKEFGTRAIWECTVRITLRTHIT